jgi:hypothetical protein
MVSLHGNSIASTPIGDVAGKLRVVTPENDVFKAALSLGLCLGIAEGIPIDEQFADSTPQHSKTRG